MRKLCVLHSDTRYQRDDIDKSGSSDICVSCITGQRLILGAIKFPASTPLQNDLLSYKAITVSLPSDQGQIVVLQSIRRQESHHMLNVAFQR